MPRSLLACTFLFASLCLSAQSLTQTVRGTLTDETSGQPLAGALVQLGDAEERTDDRGQFRFDPFPTGRYSLKVTLEGYRDHIQPGIIVVSGKETVLELGLASTLYEADEVDIIAPQVRDVDRVSTRMFTVEETKRFAAVYFDPARMAASYPGVATANDQANHLIIRGNSPSGVGWRLEGVDIVNPNHLTNAGTFSDRVSQSGGGTILLSTQLLRNSTFSTGAFSPTYGNALSGIFDIHLRQGNRETHEYTLQAGLIGVDLSAEGPISRQQGSSFLVNYRYSTVGLLGLLGISFGNEAIAYQDLAFNLHLPAGKAGTFTLFGMGGLSSNRFTGSSIDSLQETGKDRFDIDFVSNMGAVGMTHRLLLGEQTVWRTVLAASGIQSTRTGNWIIDSTRRLPVERDELTQAKLSFHSNVSHKFGPGSNLQAGIYLTQLYDSANSQLRALDTTASLQLLTQRRGGAPLIQPYINWQWQPISRLRLDLGLHAMYFFLNESRSLEPRASLSLQLTPKQQLRFAYGLHSQVPAPTLYALNVPGANGEAVFPNRELGFTRAHHLVLSYQYQFGPDLTLKLEPYFQYLFDVPVQADTTNTFSSLNLVEAFLPPNIRNEVLTNQGLGRNYGLEFSLEQYLTRTYYWLLSGALYESEYQGSDQIWRDSRFNGNYQFALTGGREFDFATKKGKDKIWGINLRMIYQGGFRAAPVDLVASQAAQRTIYNERNGFSGRLPDYFRTDLRITFKRNRPRYTRTFGIDIQNVFNTRNIAFRAYDPVANAVVDRLQLGLIPLLSYRLEF